MPCIAVIKRLHRYLLDSHWNGDGLVGPDPGIRFNLRIGRFIKSYFEFLPWNDGYYYLQAQGYWVLANLRLFETTSDERARDIAIRCADHMLKCQRADGAWDYPNPEWRGRVATAEGTWASIGLLEAYRTSGNREYLAGALRWNDYLQNTIGFQQVGGQLAVNYFANRPTGRVPNNSAFLLRFLAELADATGERSHLTNCPGLLAFLRSAQTETGEFPYAVSGIGRERGNKEHFQCYQYNAFEWLDLMRYFEITGDSGVPPLLIRSLRFLKSGVASDGHVYFDCKKGPSRAPYHTAVVGAVLCKATRFGLDNCEDLAGRAWSYLARIQEPGGQFIFSSGDYYLLSDRRAYPRSNVMMLFHALESALCSSDRCTTPSNPALHSQSSHS